MSFIGKPAIRALEIKSDSGCLESQLKLGDMYQYCSKSLDGVVSESECRELSIKYYTLAANQHHDVANYELGKIYYYLLIGTTVLDNSNKQEILVLAVKYLSLSMDCGNSISGYDLGCVFTECLNPSTLNLELGLECFKKAADLGHEGAKARIIKFKN